MTTPLVIDVSRLSAFQTCQRMFKYRYVEHWHPKTARMVAADFGTAIHCAMEARGDGGPLAAMQAAFSAKWQELGGDVPEDAMRTEEHGLWILGRYVQKWGATDVWKIKAQERAFAVHVGFAGDAIGVHPVWLIGRWDAEVEMAGAHIIVDHKTKSQMGYSASQQYKPSLQMLGYVWAARQLGEPACAMAMVNMIGTAKYGRGTPRVTPADDCFGRVELSYTDEELDEFPCLVLDLAEDILQARMTNRYVPTFGACNNYGECSFKRVCTMPVSVRQQVLEADFVQEEWSPLRSAKTLVVAEVPPQEVMMVMPKKGEGA